MASPLSFDEPDASVGFCITTNSVSFVERGAGRLPEEVVAAESG